MDKSKSLRFSPSPPVRSGNSVNKIMYTVVLALMPAFAWSIYLFGLDAVRVTLLSITACVMFEFLIRKYLLQTPSFVTDGSAVITGILLAFNLPASIPSWMIIVGCLAAIGIAKMPYGGLGNNIFNPALVGRVFMLISFPVQMTSWPSPGTSSVDAITTATPLAILKEGLKSGQPLHELYQEMPTTIEMFTGNIPGSLGEISAAALLLGGLFLLIRKVITWHIPVSMMTAIVLFSGICWIIDPSRYADPLFHLMTGGVMLGAFFMATDMVTSPMNPKSQVIFGAGIGILTMLIRLWGAYPEGVAFAILLMNAMVPLLNRSFKPYGLHEWKVKTLKG